MSKDLKVLASGVCQINRHQHTIEGIQRLGQKFILELLTEKGSMKYLPEKGCSFLSRVRRAKNEFDVMVAFSAAKSQIRRNFKAEETKKTADNERYRTAKLSLLVIEDGILHMEFIVASQAKTAVRVVTPPIQL